MKLKKRIFKVLTHSLTRSLTYLLTHSLTYFEDAKNFEKDKQLEAFKQRRAQIQAEAKAAIDREVAAMKYKQEKEVTDLRQWRITHWGNQGNAISHSLTHAHSLMLTHSLTHSLMLTHSLTRSLV